MTVNCEPAAELSVTATEYIEPQKALLCYCGLQLQIQTALQLYGETLEHATPSMRHVSLHVGFFSHVILCALLCAGGPKWK